MGNLGDPGSLLAVPRACTHSRPAFHGSESSGLVISEPGIATVAGFVFHRAGLRGATASGLGPSDRWCEHTGSLGASVMAAALTYVYPRLPPSLGVLQVLLPELLVLAAQRGGSAPTQAPDAEPEELVVQLNRLAGQQPVPLPP